MPTYDDVRAHSAAQLCLNLCNCLGCSPPGSSVHAISQARILQWVAISFSNLWSVTSISTKRYQTASLFWISAFFFSYHRDMQYGYLFIYFLKRICKSMFFWEWENGNSMEVKGRRARRWCKMNIWYKHLLSSGPRICTLMCLLLETSQPHFKWKSKVNAETESQRTHFIYPRSTSCWVTGQDEYVFWF